MCDYPKYSFDLQGMGGTLASVVNIIAISVTDNPLDMGFGYFLTAVIIIIIALIGYLALPLMVTYLSQIEAILDGDGLHYYKQ